MMMNSPGWMTISRSAAAFAQGHLQRAFHHEEQLVFDVVMMPDELAL